MKKIRPDYIAIVLYLGIMVCAVLYGMYMAYYQTTPTSDWTISYFKKVDNLMLAAGIPMVATLLYYNRRDNKAEQAGERQRKRILNIGCGLDKYGEKRLDVSLSRDDKVIGLDKHRLVGVDIVHDLDELPLPFADDEFDMIYAAHVMEHLNNTDELLMEMWRILKPKGIIKIIVPHRTNLVAYSYHHKTYWSMLSFDYIQSSNTVSGLTGLFVPSKRIKLLWPFKLLEPLVNRWPAFYEWRLSWLIPAIEVHFILEAVK